MQPTFGLEAGLLGGVALFAAIALALPLLDRANPLVRGLFVALVAALGARYLVWRVSDTLPDLEWTFSSLWPWFFVATEMLVLLNALLNAVTLMRCADRSPAADAGARAFRDGRPAPRVDVFVATYNEDRDILERTIVGAANLDWPNYRLWVLDDGRRDWLRALADEKGAGYIARPDNAHAKAGNLNYALARTDAPFVMVLDADFVPRREFLLRTMGLFDDPRVAIVQTPQHFYNADPIQHNLLAPRAWADEQRFFFDSMMPAKDAWDCAFCCGTSSVLRREALDKVGGFPTETVTEDIHLTYSLYRHGYITRYLNEDLSMGLAPEGIGEYLSQRARWCTGLLQQLFVRAGPFGRNGQTLQQRLQFVSAALYWLLFPHRIVFVLAPPVFWFTGVAALDASLGTLAAYFLPAFAANALFVMWLSRNAVTPLFWDVGQFLMTFVVSRASVATLLRPKGRAFKVTAKGGQRDRLQIHWQLAMPLLILSAVTAGGLLTLAVPETTAAPQEGRAVNVVWSVFNLVLFGLCLLAAADLPRPRKVERFAVAEDGAMQSPDGDACGVRILDLSLDGARLGGLDEPAPDRGELHIPEVGWVPVRKVRLLRPGLAAYSLDGLPAPQREALILKLFAGRYSKSVRRVRLPALVKATLRRLLR